MKRGVALLIGLLCLLIPRMPMAGGAPADAPLDLSVVESRPVPAYELHSTIIQQPIPSNPSTQAALAALATGLAGLLAWRKRNRR